MPTGLWIVRTRIIERILIVVQCGGSRSGIFIRILVFMDLDPKIVFKLKVTERILILCSVADQDPLFVFFMSGWNFFYFLGSGLVAGSEPCQMD